MPRSKKDSIVTLRVDETLKLDLKDASQKTGVPVSALIRLCINARLKEIKENYGSQGVNK
jgi:antitoxin component of RelBE/YafQ-DinJ toxin-antitoxin module